MNRFSFSVFRSGQDPAENSYFIVKFLGDCDVFETVSVFMSGVEAKKQTDISRCSPKSMQGKVQNYPTSVSGPTASVCAST
jgi:hypothetical protein